MREIGWAVDGDPGTQIFFRKLGPLSIAKYQRPNSIDYDRLAQFRRDHHTLTTYIEPGFGYNQARPKFSFAVDPFAHSMTSLVDLNPSISTILSAFTQKTRYNITRNTKKNLIQVKTVSLSNLSSSQSQEFIDLHDAWSKQKHVLGYPMYILKGIIKSFANSGDLHLCYHGSELIGSLLILYHDSVATYYAAFASPLGYTTFAPTLLTWTAMTVAKQKDCHTFDFGGIYDPRYKKMYKKWVGFTKFKSGFNPTVVEYPPTTLQLFW